ncbi:MAG: hypothetical protein ABEI86_02980 [Halobacteriaceae archaeon]
MSSSFLSLLDQNRPQTVFLPAVTFGYIYANYGSFPTCSWIVGFLPSVGGSRITFLWLAVGSTVLAAYMYGTRTSPEQPREVRDLGSVAAVTSIMQFLLLGWSFLELIVRTCSRDIIVFGLFLLYLALIVITVTENFGDKPLT